MELLKKVGMWFIDWLQAIVLVAVVFVLVYWFLIRPYEVDGASMFPTFKNGEYVLTNVAVSRFGSLVRGDVIVFEAPREKERHFVKRIIGLPGERVKIINGAVLINGQLLDEGAYLSDDVTTNGGSFLLEGQEVTVPQKNYVVIGDNRSGSSDSREWGFVDESKIIGESLMRIWPLSTWTVIQNPYEK